MFQFRRFPTCTYLVQCTLTRYCRAGLPHSEISGSSLICSYPKLIAACRVLHRLLMPRHSPCALFSLTYSWFSLLIFENYADNLLSEVLEIVFTHYSFLQIIVPQLSSLFTFVNSVALLFSFFLCSVFKVQIRRFTPFGSDCYRPALCTL